MLVLTRKPGDDSDIFDENGNHIATIRITQVKGKQVRLGLIMSNKLIIDRYKDKFNNYCGRTDQEIFELRKSFKERDNGKNA